MNVRITIAKFATIEHEMPDNASPADVAHVANDIMGDYDLIGELMSKARTCVYDVETDIK